MIEIALGLHHKMNIIPGIVLEFIDSEESVVQMCRDYCQMIVDSFR